MKKIEINIPGNKYPVFIGQNAFDSLTKVLRSKKMYKSIFLIVDSAIMNLHREDITRFTSNYAGKVCIYEYFAKEHHKNFESLQKIFHNLLDKEFGKDTVIIAVGGGITGDIAGFSASSFMRGVSYVQVATTLLAAVDSSVGGKTGINFNETKNTIGSIYQPEFVLVDTAFLRTLPEEEVICGIGEILKYAFLIDQKFFTVLKNNFSKLHKVEHTFITKVIETCILFKGDVVAQDEKENGLRKILNFGHTFAHAIEIEQNHQIKHGQAVTVGILCALDLSRRLGFLEEKLHSEMIKLPLMLRDKIRVKKFDTEKIYDIMKRDKKSRDQKIKFVLLNDYGKLIVDAEATREEVFQSITKGMSHFLPY